MNARSDAALLDIRGVTKAYGSLLAVNNVTMTVDAGERRALIGPNGAGKTTLFDLIGGRLAVSGGSITFAGQEITRTKEHRRARLGIAKTFQRSNLFDGVSALENVATAVQLTLGVAGRALRSAAAYGEVTSQAADLLETVGLADRARQRAGELSHGQRRQLEVAVALAIEPTLLLLDEPVAGMSAGERESFVGMVRTLPPALTVLVIEHDIDIVFAVASHVSVMHAGELLADGTPDEIRANDAVQEAYLGAGHDQAVFHL